MHLLQIYDGKRYTPASSVVGILVGRDGVCGITTNRKNNILKPEKSSNVHLIAYCNQTQKYQFISKNWKHLIWNEHDIHLSKGWNWWLLGIRKNTLNF